MHLLRYSLCLILLFQLLPLSAAENKSDHTMAEVNRLIQDKQYHSAWTLLHDKAEGIPAAEMILKKTELTLLYYSKTNLHQMFAFSDLEEDENLSDLRAGEGHFDFKLYDPAGALSLVIREQPGKKEAYYWLAEYYHQVMTLYGEEWELPQSELQDLVISNFRMALSLGMETEEIYSKLAYAELLAGKWDAAVKDLKKAAEFNPSHPAYHHDLAVAQLKLRQYENALSSADRAIALYTDPYYRADSSFLASTIALHLGNGDRAESYLQKGATLSPEDYRFPDRLIRLYLNTQEYDRAREAAGDLFALYPAIPSNCTTILQYFHSMGKLEETELFFESQLKRYGNEPEIMGNLYFHRAVAQGYRGLDDEALQSFKEAEKEFKKVHSDDNPVFQAIENRMSEITRDKSR